ncbi:MAG: hypothetical protein ACYCZN_15835 [Candidatus Dormibacteria bacterium]
MASMRGGASLGPGNRKVPDLDEAAGALDRSHGGHTEGKEARLDRVACAAHLTASGQPTSLTPLLLLGPPDTWKTTLQTWPPSPRVRQLSQGFLECP